MLSCRNGRFRHCGVFSILLGMCVFHGCGSETRLPSGVYVSPGIVDFGHLVDETSLNVEFQIVNSTEEPVEIVNTKLSCSCSNLSLKSRSISAGESVPVQMTAEIAGRYGRQEFQALLYTDNVATPILRLIAVGTLSSTKIVNGYHSVGNCVAGQEVETVVVISKKGATSVKALSGESDVQVVRVKDGGEVWLCDVKFNAPSRVGAFELPFAVTAEGESTWREQVVSIRGTVIGRWKVTERVYLGYLRIGESAKASFAVEDRFKNTHFGNSNRIMSCTAAGGSHLLTFKPRIEKNGGEVTIDIEFRGSPSSGPFDEMFQVTLLTSSAEEVVPVHVAAQILK